MKACAKHAKEPVKGYSECPGCEVESLRNRIADLEARLDTDVQMDVIRQSYGWTIATDGQLHGLISGDMGYEPTGIKLDAQTMRVWQLGLKAAGLAGK